MKLTFYTGGTIAPCRRACTDDIKIKSRKRKVTIPLHICRNSTQSCLLGLDGLPNLGIWRKLFPGYLKQDKMAPAVKTKYLCGNCVSAAQTECFLNPSLACY